MRLNTVLVTLAVICTLPTLGLADIPQAINYQGVLLDSGGEPASGTQEITFKIYDSPTSKAELWSETVQVEVDANGAFNAILGKLNQTLDQALTGESRYLGITIGTDAEITPRTELVSSAYSFRVGTVDGARAGTIKGGLTMEQSLDKASASLTLVGSLNDTLTLNPATGGSLIRATNENGAEIFDAAVDQTDQSMYMTIKGPGGDESAVFSASGTEMSSSNFSKGFSAFQRRISLTGANGLRVFSDANPDDILIKMAQTASGAELAFNTPSKSLATRKLMSLSQDGLKVLNATETDYKFLLDPNGEVAMKSTDYEAYHKSSGSDYYTNVAKNFAMQRTVRLAAEGFTVFAQSNPNDPIVEIKETIDGPQVLVNQSTGRGILNSIIIDSDGIVVHDNGGNVRTTLSADGDVISLGQIAVGEGCSWGPGKQGSAWSVVFGFNNTASGDTSTVSGGYQNEAAARASTISGGQGNYIAAQANHATIGGGAANYADSGWCTVAGGYADSAIGQFATIGGGNDNYAGSWASTIGGGNDNTVNAGAGVIAGGGENTVTGNYGAITGGIRNTAGDGAFVGGGFDNIASGQRAAIPGGEYNVASGSQSFAAGYHARATNSGTMVMSATNSTDTSTWVSSNYAGQFVIRAVNGLYLTNNSGQVTAPSNGTKLINTDAGSGAYLSSSGVWTDAPSARGNLTPMDGRGVLGQLEQLPVGEWRSGEKGDIKHVSPLPEEFYAHFGLGEDDRSLASLDMSGIALVAVKELYRMVQDQQMLAEKLEEANDELAVKSERIEQLELRLTQLEAAVESVMANQNNENQGSDKLAATK